ncbi:sugar ABC transporter substrate-binding protein [Mesorhizobium sp. B3-1-6]|uniref:sugar ABC transporter substrate-binding protein n=1 Tax=Mesorhizobium sp. B3-1-6 TaxID=2589895 RepID=UPI0015E4464A|nr:sugar ABC transporter substrate-binding protein [Mesorhizobium sp. B3-1-6]
MKATSLTVAALATLLASASVGTASADPLCKKEDIRFVNSMREIAQPYHGDLDKGGRLFLQSVGLSDKQYVLQLNQGDSDKQVSLMRAVLASNPNCSIFNVEPNNLPAVQLMVKTANQTGAWIVTHWSHPDGFYPYDGNDQWIAHIGVNSFDAGVSISQAMVKAMNGQGGIVALQGILDNKPAQLRFAGLQKVLGDNPGVTLLDQQTANWDRSQAFPIVQAWLSKYGDKIKGIWAANDDMALGAVEALRAQGLAGKIPVVGADGIPEAIQAVKKGEMTATVSSDAYYQGSIGFAMGYCVLTGQAPTPASWTKEQRNFNLRLIAITKDNVDQYLNPPPASAYAGDWACDKLWSRDTGPAD